MLVCVNPATVPLTQQMSSLRHGEVKQLSQGHTAHRGPVWPPTHIHLVLKRTFSQHSAAYESDHQQLSTHSEAHPSPQSRASHIWATDAGPWSVSEEGTLGLKGITPQGSRIRLWARTRARTLKGDFPARLPANHQVRHWETQAGQVSAPQKETGGRRR